jgi:hypothetical protein
MQQSGDQIGFRRKHVAVLADARDLALALQFLERLVQIHPHAALAAERFTELHFIERAVLRRRKQTQDFFL